MRRVVVDAAALVAVELVEEALERRAVEQVLARMELEADVDALLVVRVEDRPPALGEFVERGVDQAFGPRRPGIEERPGERAGEGDLGVRGRGCGWPCAASVTCSTAHSWRAFGLPRTCGRGERVEPVVIDRIDRHELALQVGRELGDLDAVLLRDAAQLLAVGLAFGGLLEVDQPASQVGNLHALVAEPGRPAADPVEGVERRRVAGELGEEDRRTLDRFHRYSSFSGWSAGLRPSPIARAGSRAPNW